MNAPFINDRLPYEGAEFKLIKVMTVIINRSSWDELLTTDFVTHSPLSLQMKA